VETSKAEKIALDQKSKSKLKQKSSFIDDQITADTDVTPEELATYDQITADASISKLSEFKHIIEKKDQEIENEKKKANETAQILTKQMEAVKAEALQLI